MTKNVRLQNLRDFTVQICTPDHEQIVGTGIAVSMEGEIVTCAHVVEAVLGVHPRDADEAEVGVYFPQAGGGEIKERRATVKACFPQHDDDIVLLQLCDGPAPLAPEQMPTLGHAEGSAGNGFRSYGYRRRAKYLAGHAHGCILGLIERPHHLILQADPVELESAQVNSGMSGAAVLDIERNLVVGVVSETWFSDGDFKDRDAAWAVNAHVLSLEPVLLALQTEPQQKGEAREPQIDRAEAQRAASKTPGDELSQAPPVLDEWVGREDLLAALSRDLADSERRVTGLIGFGGEGKSSLARKWIENVRRDDVLRADGIFWWSFYDQPSVEQFFEAALEWISGGKIDPRKVPSANRRMHIVAGMLAAGRYLFVLNGFEVMQHQDGDDYGLVKSNDLQDFLELFANPGHDSFCLVTSRAPLLDLMAYTTYTHRDVDRLTENEGCRLLRQLGVKGGEKKLVNVVNRWDGHALTVGLVGSYLAVAHDGDVTKADEISKEILEESTLSVGEHRSHVVEGAEIAPLAGKYEHVHRVLRRYDEHLSEAERAFLTLFSAFRTPVKLDGFEKVFRGKADVSEEPKTAEEKKGPEEPEEPEDGFRVSLAKLEDDEFENLVERLTAYRLLRYNKIENHYTTHPLIRNYYFHNHLIPDPESPDTHGRIKEYYLDQAGKGPSQIEIMMGTAPVPTLEDLQPLIEVVHHACRAEAYDEAWGIYWGRLQQSQSGVLVYKLGAWETDVAVLSEFFPNGDTSEEPQVSDSGDKRWILNEVGLCLMNLGRLREAAPFYERVIAGDIKDERWNHASIANQNLAELHICLGELGAAAEAADQALALAQRAENEQDEMTSLSWQGSALHLQGQIEKAKVAFQNSEEVEQEIKSNCNYLYSYAGIRHADHLRRTGQVDYARRVTEANLAICERKRWPDDTSKCHRVLGDLDAVEGNHTEARNHYDQAVSIARGISDRAVLIEALLGRGRWAAKYIAQTSEVFAKHSEPSRGAETSEVSRAFHDLNEALGYATAGGYRRYEADIRVALAWAHRAAGDTAKARAEARRALQLSREMGYHWGQVDAEEVLGKLED
jgi:tetratricopeptide (TPR) repeat protein